MRRAGLALFILCAAHGCDTADPVGLPIVPDGGVAPVDSGQTPDQDIQDSRVPDVALQDASVPVDAGTRPDGMSADSGVMEAPCTTVHTQASPASELPNTDQTTVAYGGGVTYLAWADEHGVHQCTVDSLGEFEGPRIQIAVPEVAVEKIVSLRVGGTTWIAYGSEGQPIRIYQAHRPSETSILLDSEGRELLGRPLLADASDSIMVIGQTTTGGLAWQIIPNDLSDRQVYYRDTAGLMMPNSAGASQGGIYLRFNEEGQCVFVSDFGWIPVGTLPCDEGPGELVSSGQRSILWNSERRGMDNFLSLSSLTDKSIDFVSVGRFLTSVETAMDVYRGQKPLIASRIIPRPAARIAHAQLSLAGPSGVWMSRTTWPNQWPWSDARAIAFADLPNKAGPGVCGEAGAECLTDDDCCLDVADPTEQDACLDSVDALCNGGAESMHALVFRFQNYGRPEIEYVPMAPAPFTMTGSLFDSSSTCSATPEICDGRSQDCDQYEDDGICCPVPQNGRLAFEFTTEGPIEEFLLGDNEHKNAFLLSYRQIDDGGRSFWRTQRFLFGRDDGVNTHLEMEYVRDCNQPGLMGWCGGDTSDPRNRCRTDDDCSPESPCSGLRPVECTDGQSDYSVSTLRYAGDGASVTAVGGTRAFIAKTPPTHPTPNRWGVHWLHWTRDLKGDAETPVLLPEACDEILAVEGLRRVDEGESVIVVCRDRIVRAFAKSIDQSPGATNYPDQEWRFSELGGQGDAAFERIEWASISREIVQSTCGPSACPRHDSGFKLLVAYRSSVNDLRLQLYSVRAGSDDPPALSPFPEPLNQLKNGGSDDAKTYPIYLHQNLAGPQIRFSADNVPQALFETENAAGDSMLEWRNTVSVTRPEKAVYSILNQEIFTGAPILDENGQEIGYDHWLINAGSDDGGYNLWSTTPISTEDQPVAFWDTVQSDYTHTLAKVIRLNEEGTRWEFSVHGFQCLPSR